MRAVLHMLRTRFGALLARPDEIMLEHGAGGEWFVARLRAVLSLVLLLPMPLVAAAYGARIEEVLIGLGSATFANVMAQVWLALAKQRGRYPWLPYATSAYDVSAITLALSLLTLADPVSGINSLVVWSLYFPAIAMTALRNDGRLTLFAGGLAIIQFAALVWVVFATAPPSGPLPSIDYGSASIGSQAQRLLLLMMMTVLTATIVHRMQRLAELSGTDSLTGLPNRAWLLHGMPRIFEAVRSERGSLTLALLDLDRFKRINDEMGHRDGDRAIRHFAAAVSESLEPRERLVRIGGQEFVVLMHCPIGSAWERLDRLRRDAATRPFLPERFGDAQVITFSGGLSAFPQDGGDVSALLRTADRRLQLAKRDGRNRVIARDV